MRTALRTLCTLLLTLSLVTPSLAKEPIRIIDGTVAKISDGDTVQVVDDQGTKVKLRFYGIDCPETPKGNKRTGKLSKPGQPYGVEALAALKDKLEGQRVRVAVMDIDRYQRLASIVHVGNRDINREMVAEGWAWAYRQYLARPYASDYIAAEEAARRGRLGLWAQANPQPPWEYRKSLRRHR